MVRGAALVNVEGKRTLKEYLPSILLLDAYTVGKESVMTLNTGLKMSSHNLQQCYL